MNFETLIGKASNSKEKEWTTTVSDNGDNTATITTIFGYVNGKKQTNTRIVTCGKNIGKLNETTPLQQAISEANSKWTKKRDSGYVPKSGHFAGSTPILPMLALDYSKRGHDINFPCFVQPKLDGVRCVFSNGKMTSRRGKEFLHLDHILEELKGIDHVLDGELYSDTLSFQELVGIVRRVTLTDEDRVILLQVKFVVFDCISSESFETRFNKLKDVIPHRFEYSELIQTISCPTVDIATDYLLEYQMVGYEGLILRNKLGGYNSNHRSKNLQKLKTFQDSEYTIIGFTEGEGLEKGCVIWICQVCEGKTFNVRPKGTREHRASLFETGDTYVGEMLTVKYQELTDDGIPRFPVGISIRNYE